MPDKIKTRDGEDRFFFIYNPDGPHPPRVKFDGEEEAREVARRLARHNPGQSFHVVEWKATYIKREVEEHLPSNRVPF